MDKQRKLVKWITIFFAAMLVFTFLSRAADSLNVANVDTKILYFWQGRIIWNRELFLRQLRSKRWINKEN